MIERLPPRLRLVVSNDDVDVPTDLSEAPVPRQFTAIPGGNVDHHSTSPRPVRPASAGPEQGAPVADGNPTGPSSESDLDEVAVDLLEQLVSGSGIAGWVSWDPGNGHLYQVLLSIPKHTGNRYGAKGRTGFLSVPNLHWSLQLPAHKVDSTWWLTNAHLPEKHAQALLPLVQVLGLLSEDQGR